MANKTTVALASEQFREIIDTMREGGAGFRPNNRIAIALVVEANLQGFLGHYSIAITLGLYTHVTDNKAKSEMEKLQNLYEDIV